MVGNVFSRITTPPARTTTSTGGGGGSTPPPDDTPRTIFYGPEAPVDPPAIYAWLETGLGAGGTDETLWIEDGT